MSAMAAGLLLLIAVGAVWVHRRDIRKCREAERRLFESSQRLELLIRNSPLAVIEWDFKHRVKTWTGGAEQIFGWKSEEVIGKRVDEWRFVYEADWEPVSQAMAAMEKGRSNAHHNRNYRKDGSVIHCAWYNSVLVDPSGQAECGLSVVMDITEPKQAEHALEASEERFRSIFESAPIGIFQSTTGGRFLNANSQLAQLMGYDSPEEMKHQVEDIAAQMFVNPEQRSGIVARALDAPGFILSEVAYRRRDGTILHCNLNIRAVRGRGEVTFLEGFVEDVTERKEAVEALRDAYEVLEKRVQERTADLSSANERLKELDRLKSQFLASMSHELRTPLNSIIGFTSLMRQGLTGPINAEQKKQLDIVHNSSRHLLTLINDLLDVSRIEAGRADLQREAFDFVEVADEVVHSLTPMAERKGLAVSTEIAGASIPMMGDRKRTLQVLLNLVNNAIKFTHHGGVRIEARAERDYLEVAVADTGIGIKAEHLGMLFEAFRQLDGSAKRVYEGTGLGLYLCRKLLSLMNGEIGVASEFGKGSCFRFRIPLELPVEAAERSA